MPSTRRGLRNGTLMLVVVFSFSSFIPMTAAAPGRVPSPDPVCDPKSHPHCNYKSVVSAPSCASPSPAPTPTADPSSHPKWGPGSVTCDRACQEIFNPRIDLINCMPSCQQCSTQFWSWLCSEYRPLCNVTNWPEERRRDDGAPTPTRAHFPTFSNGGPGPINITLPMPTTTSLFTAGADTCEDACASSEYCDDCIRACEKDLIVFEHAQCLEYTRSCQQDKDSLVCTEECPNPMTANDNPDHTDSPARKAKRNLFEDIFKKIFGNGDNEVFKHPHKRDTDEMALSDQEDMEVGKEDSLNFYDALKDVFSGKWKRDDNDLPQSDGDDDMEPEAPGETPASNEEDDTEPIDTTLPSNSTTDDFNIQGAVSAEDMSRCIATCGPGCAKSLFCNDNKLCVQHCLTDSMLFWKRWPLCRSSPLNNWFDCWFLVRGKRTIIDVNPPNTDKCPPNPIGLLPLKTPYQNCTHL